MNNKIDNIMNKYYGTSLNDVKHKSNNKFNINAYIQSYAESYAIEHEYKSDLLNKQLKIDNMIKQGYSEGEIINKIKSAGKATWEFIKELIKKIKNFIVNIWNKIFNRKKAVKKKLSEEAKKIRERILASIDDTKEYRYSTKDPDRRHNAFALSKSVLTAVLTELMPDPDTLKHHDFVKFDNITVSVPAPIINCVKSIKSATGITTDSQFMNKMNEIDKEMMHLFVSTDEGINDGHVVLKHILKIFYPNSGIKPKQLTDEEKNILINHDKLGDKSVPGMLFGLIGNDPNLWNGLVHTHYTQFESDAKNINRKFSTFEELDVFNTIVCRAEHFIVYMYFDLHVIRILSRIIDICEKQINSYDKNENQEKTQPLIIQLGFLNKLLPVVTKINDNIFNVFVTYVENVLTTLRNVIED